MRNIGRKAAAANDRFIAALTETDQLSPTERKRAEATVRSQAKRDLKTARYVAWVQADAAYHEAEAAGLRAMCARVNGWPDAKALNRKEIEAVGALVDAARKLMRLPILSKDDASDRQVLVRKWRKAGKGNLPQAMWDAAVGEWNVLTGTNAQGEDR